MEQRIFNLKQFEHLAETIRGFFGSIGSGFSLPGYMAGSSVYHYYAWRSPMVDRTYVVYRECIKRLGVN